MNNLVIFLDLDGSIKSEHDDVGPYEVPSITIKSGDNIYNFAPRPFVKEFLNEVSKICKRLILCTAGGGNYARKVLKSMNIENYFTDIIAAEDFSKGFQIKKDWYCIFVDNSKEMVNLKVEKLSGNYLNTNYNKYIWLIDTYHGKKDDKTMLELLEEIKKL